MENIKTRIQKTLSFFHNGLDSERLNLVDTTLSKIPYVNIFQYLLDNNTNNLLNIKADIYAKYKK